MSFSTSHVHTIEEAQKAIEAAKAVARGDARRPRFHFHAPAQWMNDPNGPIFHGGWYHLFYQTNPFGERCWGAPDARVCWGHARSRDLLHWEHLPLAIWPSLELGEEHCWSGSCVIRDDGVPMIFYTSIGPDHLPKDGAEQWAALGDAELIHWTKHPANPMVRGKVFGGKRLLEWRDPFVFREAGSWYMATGGHCDGGRGCIALFRSADLEQWEFMGYPIEGDEENWECPCLFRLGESWVVIYSPHGPMRYLTGRMDFEHCRFVPQCSGRLDYASFINSYAGTVMPLSDGRTLLWAWMFSNEHGRGWNGCLVLPRELRLLPDGRLAQRPARELESLRRDPQRDSGIVTPESPRRYATPGGCAEAMLTVGRAGAARFGMRLLAHDGSAVEVAWPSMPWVADEELQRLRGLHVPAEIACTHEGVMALGDRVPPEALDGITPRELRVYIDRSLVEVFIDEQLTVCRWLDTESVDAIEFFAEGGEVEWEAIRVWRIAATVTE